MPTPRILTAVLPLIAALAGAVVVCAASDEPAGEPLDLAGLERIAQRGGVEVYQDTGAAIIRLGAVGVLPAPPERVRAALLDYEAQVGVIARLSECRVLDRGDDWVVVYERLNLPVIADRDYVIRTWWGEDDGGLWLRYREVAEEAPAARPGAVRTPLHRGSWRFTPVADGAATRLQYRVAIDLGGWLPKWLARSGAGREVPQVYAEICQMLGLGATSPTPCPAPGGP